MSSIFWIIILAVFILIEIITLSITTIWFAGGALAAFITSLFFDNLILEIIIFMTVSLALLYFTRPVVIKYFHPKNTKTDYEGVIGKEACVTATVDNMNAEGQVEVEGQRWSARSLYGTIIEKGTKVRIQGISGAKLIVSEPKTD
jgi:membrane protein implicated in regulation of membrane protease activity